MVEKKNLSSPPLTKMPKSFFGIYQKKKKKDILLSKTKRKPQRDNRRGAFAIKSNPIPTGQAIHKLPQFLPQEGEFQSPHQAPQPGVCNQEEVSQSIWLSRPEGFGCKSSIGLKEAETPPWKAHIRFQCPETQSKAVTPQEPRTDLLVGSGRSPEEAGVGCGSPVAEAAGWQGHWWQRPQGIFIR